MCIVIHYIDSLSKFEHFKLHLRYINLITLLQARKELNRPTDQKQQLYEINWLNTLTKLINSRQLLCTLH